MNHVHILYQYTEPLEIRRLFYIEAAQSNKFTSGRHLLNPNNGRMSDVCSLIAFVKCFDYSSLHFLWLLNVLFTADVNIFLVA